MQLIGNAQWHAIPLKELLGDVPGGTAAPQSVMFKGLDDFYSGVSIERATDDYAFLAMRMNGAPPPTGHGFPTRVILPDLYGMKQPRWLQSITFQPNGDTFSFWEECSWDGEVPVKAMSRPDPPNDIAAGDRVALTGVAFAGRRRIARVEVSLDGSAAWVDREIITPQTEGI